MILILVPLLVFIFAVSYKKSKPLAFAIMALAWILFAFNYDNPDYDNYVARYDSISTWFGVLEQGVSDIGFALIMRWFYVIGFNDYYHFKFVFIIIPLLCYHFFAIKSVKYLAFWAFLYFAFYTTLDITQLRNFVGFSLVLVLFPLLERDSIKSNIMFLIGVLFASTIHFSMAFFGVMGLRMVKSKKKRVLLIIIVLIVVFVLRGVLFSSMQESSYYNKVDGYTRTSILGALVTSFLFVANYLMMHFNYLQYKKDTRSGEISNEKVAYEMNLVNTLSLYLLFLIPFVFINAMPSRILRFASLIEIGFLLNYAYLSNRRRKKLITICFSIAFFFFIWTLGAVIDGLKYNYFFNYFI